MYLHLHRCLNGQGSSLWLQGLINSFNPMSISIIQISFEPQKKEKPCILCSTKIYWSTHTGLLNSKVMLASSHALSTSAGHWPQKALPSNFALSCAPSSTAVAACGVEECSSLCPRPGTQRSQFIHAQWARKGGKPCFLWLHSPTGGQQVIGGGSWQI